MVSLNAWLDGGSGTAIIIFTTIVCLIFLYRAKKLQLKVLAVAAFMILFVGLIYTAPFLDLITLIFTDKNLEPSFLYGILAYVWAAPALVCGIYIGAQLLNPEKKWYILLIFIILGVAFECFLLLDPLNNLTITEPLPLSGDLIDTQFKLISPLFILAALFLTSVLIMNGMGFLQKARQLEGAVRKRFLYLSLTFILFTIFASFDAFVAPGPALVLVRIGMVSITITLYYGLKPT